jgi:predicted phosphodiesterase
VAASQVHVQPGAVAAAVVEPEQARAARRNISDHLMSPVYSLATQITRPKAGLSATPPVVQQTAALGTVGTAKDCAEAAAKFLWAEATGNHKDATTYENELKKSVCDVGGWATCVTNYLAFKASGGHFPYRSGLDPVFTLNAQRVGIIGDWGTGEELAVNVLQQMKTQGIDVVIHLGDIYFSGLQHEAQANFLDVCRKVLGNSIPLFSLCGNHDMYSGGNGYYWLVDQLKQQASYFCIRVGNWQLVAVDSGNQDRNPLTVASNMTFLNGTEIPWALNKINDPNYQTILLSHHQLFSPFGSVGEINGAKYGYNPNFYSVFQPVLNKIQWWFWGHEHTLAVYNPYMGLQRARCIGASAVPVFTSQQSYKTDRSLQTLPGSGSAGWQKNGELGVTKQDYNHAFAILSLASNPPTVFYYEVPLGNGTAILRMKE